MNHFDPAAFLIFDILFEWNSKIENINHQCHLKIYKITFDQAIIIYDVLNNSNHALDEEIIDVIDLVCR